MGICSSKNLIDPKVVNKKTHVAKIGYDFERSLNVKTLSQIMKEQAYKTNPTRINGFAAALESSRRILVFSPLTPPKDITPFLSSILAVTLNVTLRSNS